MPYNFVRCVIPLWIILFFVTFLVIFVSYSIPYELIYFVNNLQTNTFTTPPIQYMAIFSQLSIELFTQTHPHIYFQILLIVRIGCCLCWNTRLESVDADKMIGVLFLFSSSVALTFVVSFMYLLCWHDAWNKEFSALFVSYCFYNFIFNLSSMKMYSYALSTLYWHSLLLDNEIKEMVNFIIVMVISRKLLWDMNTFAL